MIEWLKRLFKKNRYTVLTVTYNGDMYRSWICESEDVATDTLYWWTRLRWPVCMRSHTIPDDLDIMVDEFYQDSDEDWIICNGEVI